MKSQWFTHLKDDKEIEKFKEGLLHCKWAFERLKEILQEKYDAMEKTQTGTSLYSEPGWDALLAYYSGAKATIRLIQELITFDRKETK